MQNYYKHDNIITNTTNQLNKCKHSILNICVIIYIITCTIQLRLYCLTDHVSIYMYICMYIIVVMYAYIYIYIYIAYDI